ncbi:alpha-ribazole phosphatase [Carboxylicivirga marina]|uniref:Alpha-ribazole phosphatase n=1 Tax=Carboxylicivirga marina TaxID=2800988 RepID=A0ABS1HNM8_9BACT|nr:alpha-ribazole phosphatase [Carboxylicivirga marina]MBK3519269.1 alpha-ribazole phosphatase [Carboxylicivirga marina]
MEIWLIRHTTPNIDKGICYGQLNLDVADSFNDEVEHIKLLLSNNSFDKVFTSPLLRCTALAKRLFPSEDIHFEEQIKEINFGDWEGQKWDEINKQQLNVWSHDFLQQSPPNGENFSALLERALNFNNTLANSNLDKAAIVTHSGIIRAFLMEYLEIPATKIFNLELSYGAIIKITIHSSDYKQVQFIKG